MNDQRGFSLLETLAALAIAALLVVSLLEIHAALQQRMRYEAARWQAHERARIAALLLEDELRLAGFWGRRAADAEPVEAAAVTGGEGRILCAGSPCGLPGKDRLMTTGDGDSALVVRFARAQGDPLAAGLPPLAGAAQGAQAYYYAAGYYLDPSGPGLYLRIAGRSAAQELVRGIIQLDCAYALAVSAGGGVSAFRRAGQVDDWQRVVAVRCTLRAQSDPLRLAGGALGRLEAERELLVALRNPLDQQLAAQRLKTLAAFEAPK